MLGLRRKYLDRGLESGCYENHLYYVLRRLLRWGKLLQFSFIIQRRSQEYELDHCIKLSLISSTLL